ncbi:hypothetical protein LPB140_03585 [Sphingorhabdus lutea]|uniref:Teneurin-like YD-shell domain-containing protein n=1 Tax=Sphingorhabdus lutea TaxID=1913578 RepID=A0A1L3JAA0_9SPHN|nr:RHS repeat-associated core domain-containing protein [Sphingorhabdus lutea]APG62048.1 hypothetical protein LPB140_03585 [Sphingorhabdus lutea]
MPVGASVSTKIEPLGLASNWTFDFAHEIQLATVSGTPASPNVKLALVASDGTAYDFMMQSGGAIVPDTTTGAQYAPKNIKIEFVGTLPSSLATITSASSQWKMTDESETVWTFQTFTRQGFSGYIMGRPLSKVTKENYRWDFTYNNAGALQKITDSHGRQMLFDWHYFHVSALAGQGSWPTAVKSVTLPDGTSLRYNYDPAPSSTAPSTSQIQRLIKVERLNNNSTVLRSKSYTYNDARFPWHVTSIARTDGTIIASYSYDSKCRGATSSLAGNVEPYAVTSTATASEAIRSVTGPLGQVDQYRFQKTASTPQFRLTSVNSAASPTTAASSNIISYGTDNFIKSTTNQEGRVTNFTRNARGNALSTVDAATTGTQQTTSLIMHPTLNLPVQIAQEGLTTNYTYDMQGKMLSRSETDTTTHSLPYATNGQVRNWSYSWSTTGRLLSINGPKAANGVFDDISTFAYNPQGNLISVTNGLGHATIFAGHDGSGRPSTMTDSNGIITAFTYDALGQTTSINVKHPNNSAFDAVTSIEYDVEGRVTGITTPLTAKMTMTYDPAGRLTSLNAPDGEKIEYSYDAMSNVTAQTVKRANGSTSSSILRSFDSLGRVLSETLGPNRTTRWSYDKVGNPIQMVSARNNATQMAFDSLDRLVQNVAPDNSITTNQYNNHDDQIAFTDAKGVTTNFVHNGFGDVIQEISPDRGTNIYYYDASGQMTAAVDGRGQRIDYIYDILGRLTQKTPYGKPQEAYNYYYDNAAIVGSYSVGRLSYTTDSSGITKYKYDHRGNLLIKQQGIGTTSVAQLQYVYDLADRVISITYPSGRIVNYNRDIKGRVASVTTQSNASAPIQTLASDMTYESYGALTSVNFGNGTSLAADWGNDGRLVSRRLYKNIGGNNLSYLTYEYDNDDNITGLANMLDANQNISFTYDNRGRLQRFILGDTSPSGAASGAAVQRRDWTFDANGNWLQSDVRSGAADNIPAISTNYAITGGTNKLSSANDNMGSRTFTHDARGNLTAETRQDGTNVAAAYDGHGRLISYARTSSGVTSTLNFAYNAADDRVMQSNIAGGASSTLHYIYDDQGRMMGEYGTGASDIRGEYIYLMPDGANDNPSPFGGDDGLGGYGLLGVATLGINGAPIIEYIHADHIGAPLLYTNEMGQVISPGVYTLPAFPGQAQTLPDLYYNRYRDYDPTTGRYIQADPIGLEGGPSPYQYALGNPIRYTDPTGLKTIWEHYTGMPDSYRINTINFIAGWSDTYTLGLTYSIREIIGSNDDVITCSTFYDGGSMAGLISLGSAARNLPGKFFRSERLFGRNGKGFFNRNDILRIGRGWKGNKGGGREVFRLAFGNKKWPKLPLLPKFPWHIP